MSSRRKILFRWGIAVSALALAIVVVVYFARKAPAAVSENVTHDVPWLDGKSIRFSPGFAERAKIVMAPVETGSLSPVVSVTGTVSFDPERVAALGARIPGRIRHVLKLPGDRVAKGEAVLDLESAELGQAQAAVLAAQATALAARANEARETELAEQRVSSARDAEVARAAATAANADLLAAEQKVRALGGSAGGELGVLVLRSPIAGKVIELGVARGQSVEPTLTAARVADLSRVWIELAVFERELGRIRPGDDVEISPQTDTHRIVNGTVAHVGDVINLDTRSAPVRVVVENVEETLRPGQSVLARIHVAAKDGEALLLPRDAVVSIDGKQTVFVAHDATSVEPRAVETGASDGTRIEIASGLETNDRVVVSGVFALKSEVFR